MGRIISGIILIILGISGQFVLRGTNSSAALAVVGVILVVIGAVPYIKARIDAKLPIPLMTVLCPRCRNKVQIPSEGVHDCPSCGNDFYFGENRTHHEHQCPECTKWYYVHKSNPDHTCYKCKKAVQADL